MKTKHIEVKNKRAIYNEADGHIVCGNCYDAEFAFDEEWSAHEVKRARFTFWHKGRYESIDVEFKGNICPIPPLFNIKFVKIGVYVEGGISTTTAANIACDESILCGASKSVLRADEVDAINDALILWMKQNPPKDGVSPTVDVAVIDNGYKVSITDANGSHEFVLLNGEKGERGEQGAQGIQGERGERGEKGDPYTLTDEDRSSIVADVLNALPNGDEVSY